MNAINGWREHSHEVWTEGPTNGNCGWRRRQELESRNRKKKMATRGMKGNKSRRNGNRQFGDHRLKPQKRGDPKTSRGRNTTEHGLVEAVSCRCESSFTLLLLFRP